MVLAIIADALQIVVFPLFVEGALQMEVRMADSKDDLKDRLARYRQIVRSSLLVARRSHSHSASENFGRLGADFGEGLFNESTP